MDNIYNKLGENLSYSPQKEAYGDKPLATARSSFSHCQGKRRQEEATDI